jgi:GT2 family glycosyltransferase
MDLSIIIVPYKCKDVFKVALDAVFASKTNFDYEVIVVDNDSQDGTVEMVQQDYLSKPDIAAKLTLITNTNEGFARGNNRGLKVSKGAYKLLLNPDTKVAPDTLQIMMDFMKSRPDVGMSTCKLVKGDGNLDAACRRSLPDPWNGFMRVTGLSFLFPKSKLAAGYNLSHADPDTEMEIGACVGAFMFVSPSCYEKIGMLDEQFFMYGEDLDWCKRAHDAGFKVWYYPKTTTMHYKGSSSKKNSKKALYEFHNTMWQYYRKHLAGGYSKPLNWLVCVGIWSRYVLQLTKNAFRKQAIVSK